jgi:hypothetical protein
VSATLSQTGPVFDSHIREGVSWWHLKLKVLQEVSEGAPWWGAAFSVLRRCLNACFMMYVVES